MVLVLGYHVRDNVSVHLRELKLDVSIAKNYFNKEESQGLSRIVTMYLDYAEDQDKQHIPTHMSD